MNFLANPVYLFESHGFTLFKGSLLICGKRTSRERFYAFSLALRKGFFLKRNFFCMCEFKAWGNLD